MPRSNASTRALIQEAINSAKSHALQVLIENFVKALEDESYTISDLLEALANYACKTESDDAVVRFLEQAAQAAKAKN